MNIYVKKYWKSFVWLLFILFLSFVKLPSTAQDAPVFTDKLVHIFLYLVLASLMRFEKINALQIILFAAILGGTLEILQGSLTTYRSADFLDWLCDIFGAITGLYVYVVVKFLKGFSNKSNLFLL